MPLTINSNFNRLLIKLLNSLVYTTLLPCHKAQGAWRKRVKDCESEVQEAWRNWHLLGTTGPFHWQQLRPPPQTQSVSTPACSGQRLTSPSLAEGLLTVGGFWGSRCQFSWATWSLVDEPTPVDGPIPTSIRAAQTGLFKTYTKESEAGRKGKVWTWVELGIVERYNQNTFVFVQNSQRINKNHSIKILPSLNPKDLTTHFLQFKPQGHFGFLGGRRASK